MKKTKKALITSLFSMLLCIAMLVGSTMAWFTDTASNTGNRIQAGTLDIDLLMYKDDEFESIAGGTGDIFEEADNATNSNITLWEPGKTQVVFLGIQNKGSLALNYQVYLDVTDYGLCDNENTATENDSSLEYVIVSLGKDETVAKSYISNFTTVYTDWDDIKNIANTINGNVLKGRKIINTGVLDEITNNIQNETEYFALAVHMDEDAGNDYQDKYCIIDVNIVAGQQSAEYDGFGTNTYDESSEKLTVPEPVTDVIDAVVGSENDGSTKFETNVTPANTNLADEKTIVTIPAGTVGFDNDDNSTLVVEAYPTLAASQKFEISAGESSVGAIDLTVKVNGEEVTEFKDSNNDPVEVTVSTFVAKNMTGVSLKYNGTDGKSQPTDVTYDPNTGELTFKTTHFSQYLLGANEVAYLEETNMAYLTLNEALDAVDALTDKKATIAMLKDTKTVLSTSCYDSNIQADQGYLINGFVINFDVDVTIDLNGKTISNGFVADGAKELFYTKAKAETGTAIINNGAVNNYGVTVFTNLGTLTLEDSVGTGKVINSSAENSTRNGYTSSVIYCLYGSTTNLNNVKVQYNDENTSDTHGYAIYAYDTNKSDNSSVEKVTINISGGSVIGHGYAMNLVSIAKLGSSNTSDSGSTVNIQNGTTMYDESALGLFYVDGPYTINISNANFYSDSEYEGATFNIRKGTLNISGGSFSNLEYNLFAFGKSSNKNAGTINVSGGNFISVDAEINVPDGGKLEITGGTFNCDYAQFVKDGYTSILNSDGTYTVTANQ